MSEPTRGNNIHDVILSNDELTVFDVQCHPPFSTSDHMCLSWSVWFPVAYDKRYRPNIEYNFARADYDALDNYLSTVDWVHMFAVLLPIRN